ncbi:hypothetical protein SAMN05444920_101976 [Nonomuraea solani]|uniref:Uncharacterized protein n=1 Tax=Nonomuraea solani TaxID=1144553 RepID=A0A1H5VST5_9ACTN|nr:hypothetical protein [Nonomuraea solani]SEF90369.1 hypothetical protein SAMN05444920_101976 [Nonomuraea solani]
MERLPLRTSVVTAVVLAGGLLAAPAPASATPSTTVVSVPQATVSTVTLARPRNGAILSARISGGIGLLKIKNGTSKDGVVALVRGKTKAISIYVRAKSTATIRTVSDGTYKVYFTTGYRYSTSKRRFTSSATYQRFNTTLKYRTTSTYRPGWSLSIHPVKGGNARTTQINPKDFPA